VALALIDNSEDREVADESKRPGKLAFAEADVQLHFLHGQPTSATALRTT